MITLYLEAKTMGELRAQMYAILGDALGGSYTLPPLGAQDYNLTPDRGPPARDPVPEAESKPRRKHRATRPPVATPVPIEELFEEAELGGYDEITPEEPLEVTPVSPPADAVVNEKVKAEVIGRLADLFTAGKVKVLRGLLDQYGEGAKSFPEIDAAKFPAIREALDRGIAA